MVGVARIELATPAMSRQGHCAFSAENVGFPMFQCANGAGTDGELRQLLPHFYRRGDLTMKTVAVETDSPLVNFAQFELSRIGDIYDGMVNEAAVDIVGLFAAQGHSGGSAHITTEIVSKLMRYEPLSPLTGEDSEWTEVSDGLWQNKRCSHVFKDEARAWDIELPREGEQWATIAFPYEPA